MYWTLELASFLSDAPWPMTKAELIDYAIRTGAPMEVVENLQAIEDEGEIYESISEAAKQTGTQRSNISKCCNGERKTAGGLEWQYIKE